MRDLQRWEWKGHGMVKDPNGHWVWYEDVEPFPPAPEPHDKCEQPITSGLQEGRPCAHIGRFLVSDKRVCGVHARMLRADAEWEGHTPDCRVGWEAMGAACSCPPATRRDPNYAADWPPATATPEAGDA